MEANSHKPYSSDDLRTLTRVLEEALDATVNGVMLPEPQLHELSTQLGKVLMDHFTAGETDPERLKKIAIKSVKRQ